MNSVEINAGREATTKVINTLSDTIDTMVLERAAADGLPPEAFIAALAHVLADMISQITDTKGRATCARMVAMSIIANVETYGKQRLTTKVGPT